MLKNEIIKDEISGDDAIIRRESHTESEAERKEIRRKVDELMSALEYIDSVEANSQGEQPSPGEWNGFPSDAKTAVVRRREDMHRKAVVTRNDGIIRSPHIKDIHSRARKVADGFSLLEDAKKYESLIRPQLRYRVKRLIVGLKDQYIRQKADLERKSFSAEGLLGWEQLEERITPEVVAGALAIQNMGGTAKGLLVPTGSHLEQLAAIEDHSLESFVIDPLDKILWNDGKEWASAPGWRYVIVDDSSIMKDDTEIKGNNRDKILGWSAKFAKMGLTPLTGVETYLALMITSIEEGNTLDRRSMTVLNVGTFEETGVAAVGYFGYGRMRLDKEKLDSSHSGLRLRAMVEVNLYR